jgi:superfamily II DNA or RNA helicase
LRDGLSVKGLQIRKYQTELAREIITNVLGKRDTYVNLEYGLGKTLLAQMLSISLKKSFGKSFGKILYLSPRLSINEQYFRLSQLLSSNSILLVNRKLASDCDRLRRGFRVHDYIVATPWMLDRRLFCIEEQLPQVSLCILDEVDMLTAKEYVDRPVIRYHLNCSNFLTRLRAAHAVFLGLTATRLGQRQREFWINELGFELLISKSPDRLEYLPQTQIEFHTVEDERIENLDDELQSKLKSLVLEISSRLGTRIDYELIEKIAKRGMAAKMAPGSDAAISVDLNLVALCRSVMRLQAQIRHLYEDCMPGSKPGGAGCVFRQGGKANELAEILRHQVTANKMGIVFSGLKTTCDNLASCLRQEDIKVAVAHGGVSKGASDLSVVGFKRREYEVLVMTTDYGGRGLDFPEADYLVLYRVERSLEKLGQIVGRIRGNMLNPKRAHILCYAGTKEIENARHVIDAITHSEGRRKAPEFVLVRKAVRGG